MAMQSMLKPDQLPPARLWRGVWKWLALLPLIWLLIYLCSQTAHLGLGYPMPAEISSNLGATYAPWERVVLAPISTAIIQDIPEWQDTSYEELTHPGVLWVDPTATPLPTVAVTAFPSRSPTSTSTIPATSTATLSIYFTRTPTRTPTRTGTQIISQTPTHTDTPTVTWWIIPTINDTSTPSKTPTYTLTPTITPTTVTPTITPTTVTPTISPTTVTPPPQDPTFTWTPTTITWTPTDTIMPTITRTPTPTAPPCGGSLPPGEPDIGPPDGNFASLPCGGVLILDLVALGFNPIDLSTPDADYDLVFYERKVPSQNANYIEMDWVSVEIGTRLGDSCIDSTWYMGFNWGDDVITNNGRLGTDYYPESDNLEIYTTDLWGSPPLQTGIAIDLDSTALGIPPGLYPCIRIISPFNDPGNDSAEVDAVQILP